MIQPIIFDVFAKELDNLFKSEEYIQNIKKIEPSLIAANGKFSDTYQRVVFNTPDEKYVSAFYKSYNPKRKHFIFQLLTFKQVGNVSDEIKSLCFEININTNELSNVIDKSPEVQFNELKKYFAKHLALSNFKIQKNHLGQHFDVFKVIKEFINESCIQINNGVASFKFDNTEISNTIKNQLITKLFNKL